MKFCLNLSHHPWVRAADRLQAASATLDAISAADRAGLHSVWVSEDPDGWDAFALLGAAARVTDQIRLGTGVTNPYLRHPNLLAMSTSTLDLLSGGRAFLGLGRGQPEWYQRRLGISTGSPLQVLSETIDLLRQWWQSPHVATSDRHFQVRDWHHGFGSLDPAIPIYLAALGPQARKLAARQADGWLVAEFASLAFLERTIPEMQQHVRQSGRNPAQFPIFFRTAIEITDDPEPALNQRKNLLALVNALPGMAQHIDVPGFDTEAIMADVRRVMRTDEVLGKGGAFIDIRRVADFKAARALIPTEWVEAISYVGTPAKVRQKLRQLADLGVTHVFVVPPKDARPEVYADLLDALRPPLSS